MFCPLCARKVDTAETMPGRSGQERVRTYWWSGISFDEDLGKELEQADLLSAVSELAPLRQSQAKGQDEAG
jgi:hypothetical protein